MSMLKGIPQRKVKRPDSYCFQGIRKRSMALPAEAFAPQNQGHSANQPDDNAATLSDPAIVKRIFQKICDSVQNSRNANTIEPNLPNLFFQTRILGCF